MLVKYCKIIFILGSFLLLAALRAEAVIIQPTVDATIFDGVTAARDGVGDFINDTQFVQGLNNATFESRGIVEFDLSSIAGPVSSASLNLRVDDDLGPFPFTLDFYIYTGDGIITFGDFMDGTSGFTHVYGPAAQLDFDVTVILQGLQNTNAPFAGFAIRKIEQGPAGAGPAFVSFGSLDSQQPALLSVNESGNGAAVPEPAALTLFGSGVFGFALVRRKFNKID